MNQPHQDRPINTGIWLLLLIGAVLVALMHLRGGAFHADNTWHFRWIRTLLSGDPVFWYGVEANRVFPDLLYASLAYLGPGGQDWTQWRITYVMLQFAGTLIAMSTGVFLLQRMRDRQTGAATEPPSAVIWIISLLVIWLYVTAESRYFAQWTLRPGMHGAAAPLLVLLLLWAGARLSDPHRSGRWLWLPIILCGALLVGSNKALMVSLLGPWLLAMVAVAARTGVNIRHITVFAVLVACLGLAISTALESAGNWHQVGELRLAAVDLPQMLANLRGTLDTFGTTFYQGARFDHVSRDAAGDAPADFWGIWIGLLLVTILALWARDSGSGAPLVLVFLLTWFLIATISTATFTVLFLPELGGWRYRLLVQPAMLGLLALSLLLAQALAGPSQARLVTLTMAFIILAKSVQYITWIGPEQEYQRVTGELSTRLATLVAPDVGGIAPYQIAESLNARLPADRFIAVDDAPNRALSMLKNTRNAGFLCKREFRILLRSVTQDQPHQALLDQRLGPAQLIAPVQARFPFAGQIEIRLYPATVLDTAIIQPARKAASQDFPAYPCP